MLKQTIQRTNVTIDDRRSVIVLARGRKPADVAKVPHEAFLRQQLKARMGYGTKDSAPDSIKQAAKEMAASLLREAKVAADAAAAKAKEASTEAPKGWNKVEGGTEHMAA